MTKTNFLSFWKEYGTDVCLADMESVDLECNSDSPITLKGTFLKFLVLATLAVIALLISKYLLATNIDGMRIKKKI